MYRNEGLLVIEIGTGAALPDLQCICWPPTLVLISSRSSADRHPPFLFLFLFLFAPPVTSRNVRVAKLEERESVVLFTRRWSVDALAW